jgi:hypothetical protein
MSQAASVEVSDDAHVLNISTIKKEAANLSRSIFIFTTASFPLDPPPDWMKDETAKANYQKTMLSSKFDLQMRDYMNSHDAAIAIGIDVKDRYVSIQSKDDVPLSTNEAKQAVSTFKTNVANNDYNAALLAMLENIKDTIATNESAHAWDGVRNVLMCVGVIAFFALVIMLNKMFGWNSSGSNRSYHHSSYHSSSSSDYSSSDYSSSSDSSSSGGSAGDFF